MDAAIRTSTDADHIMTVLMDVPGKPVNPCTPQLLEGLTEALLAIERDKPAGVIFASAKARSFNAGADLFEIRKMTREQLAGYLALGQSIFDRIAHLSIPTVAAINGDCLGGGYELALACRYRVAVEDTSISIGLPEVKLGLIPAWGGSTRLPQLLGLTKALPILLAGKTMPPRKAMKAGLVDEVVRPEALLAAAKRLAGGRASQHQPSLIDRSLANVSFARRKVLESARKKTLETTHGNYPAPMRLLEVVETGLQHGPAAGLAAELQAILELTNADAGKNLLRLFFLRQGAKRLAAEKVSAKPTEVKYAAVIGGGTMGAGIVYALIRAGIFVRLIEVDPPAVSAALGRIKKMLDEDVYAGRLDRLAARHAFNRVAPATDWSGLELADFVVEAVIETIEAKRDVFNKLDRLTRPNAVLASNTSSLRIADMAQATLHPERVVGLHFFNPVSKMPLVEVVRGPASDDQSLATAIGLSSRIGKTPIFVNDAPGFVVNRILIPYLAEAVAMIDESVPITAIDEAMKKWGMPMGPFELLDEIGLDIAMHVLASLQGKESPLLKRAIEQKWLGKKTGKGFYVYDKRAKKIAKPKLNEELVKPSMASVNSEDVTWRLVLPMVNEAARLLEEHVTDSTDTIDLATVLGLGLAPFRGGLVKFAGDVGMDEIERRMEELASRLGPRFKPAASLRQLGQKPATRPQSPAPVQPVGT